LFASLAEAHEREDAADHLFRHAAVHLFDRTELADIRRTWSDIAITIDDLELAADLFPERTPELEILAAQNGWVPMPGWHTSEAPHASPEALLDAIRTDDVSQVDAALRVVAHHDAKRAEAMRNEVVRAGRLESEDRIKVLLLAWAPIDERSHSVRVEKALASLATSSEQSSRAANAKSRVRAAVAGDHGSGLEIVTAQGLSKRALSVVQRGSWAELELALRVLKFESASPWHGRPILATPPEELLALIRASQQDDELDETSRLDLTFRVAALVDPFQGEPATSDMPLDKLATAMVGYRVRNYLRRSLLRTPWRDVWRTALEVCDQARLSSTAWLIDSRLHMEPSDASFEDPQRAWISKREAIEVLSSIRPSIHLDLASSFPFEVGLQLLQEPHTLLQDHLANYSFIENLLEVARRRDLTLPHWRDLVRLDRRLREQFAVTSRASP
jgi:hypothetical protein